MKKKIFILFCAAFILFFASCKNEQVYYEFPISEPNIEKVLNENQLKWFVKEINEVSEYQSIITLTNDDKAIVGINSRADEGRKILSLAWALPSNITDIGIEKFYNKDLPELFNLVGIFYGNKENMDNGLEEFVSYYLNDESHYSNGVFWVKRIGDDHLRGEIKTGIFRDDRSRSGGLLVMSNSSHESYLKAICDMWLENGESNSIEINKSTVADILKIPYTEEIEPVIKHFIVNGRLENITELKTVPEALIHMGKSYVIPNKDKYLSATLIDEAGSLNVILQPTSLKANELRVERAHQVILFYYKGNLVYVVWNSALIN